MRRVLTSTKQQLLKKKKCIFTDILTGNCHQSHRGIISNDITLFQDNANMNVKRFVCGVLN